MKLKFSDFFGGSEIDTDSKWPFPKFDFSETTTTSNYPCLREGTHCYCQEDTTPPRTKPHVKCCMCSHVKLRKG